MEQNQREKLNEIKARKKGFLQAMPDDQRRLLKMQQRSVRNGKRLLYLIPALFVILVIAYLVLCLRVPYKNNWTINAIAGGLIFVIGTILLLVRRSSVLKKAKALSSSIPDFIEQYEQFDRSIHEIKKDGRSQMEK